MLLPRSRGVGCIAALGGAVLCAVHSTRMRCTSAASCLPSLISSSLHLCSSALACGHSRCFRRWLPQVRASALHPFTLLRGSERRGEQCGTGRCSAVGSSLRLHAEAAVPVAAFPLFSQPHLTSSLLLWPADTPAVSGGGCRRSELPPSILSISSPPPSHAGMHQGAAGATV